MPTILLYMLLCAVMLRNIFLVKWDDAMLIRLFGENYCSLRDPFELSFMAADLSSEGGRGISSVQLSGSEEPLDVLRCLVIFGANASGKTTVLNAANALQWMIRHSSRKLEPGMHIPPYEPFAFNPNTQDRPIRLGCTVSLDGHLYEYSLEYSIDRIHQEELVRLDEPDIPLLKRDQSNQVGGKLVELNDQVRALVSQPRSNTPVFSILAQHGPESGQGSVLHIWKAFCDHLLHSDYRFSFHNRIFGLSDPIAKRLHGDHDFRNWMKSHLIQPADLGIREVRAEEMEIPSSFKDAPEEVRKQLSDESPFYRSNFLHYGSDRALNLNQESAGTCKMYSLAEDWWALAHESITIFGDELSASLHPLLIEHLIRAINEPPAGRDIRGQLAFASHDVGLLESRDGQAAPVRRDQVYFTKKDESGATTLYSLAEFKDQARSVHNLRKRYLEDRYGAIPRIEGLSL